MILICDSGVRPGGSFTCACSERKPADLDEHLLRLAANK